MLMQCACGPQHPVTHPDLRPAVTDPKHKRVWKLLEDELESTTLRLLEEEEGKGEDPREDDS